MDHAKRNNLDWNLIQSFLAVVEFGSVSRAAEAIGSSQPTLSRQIAALEAEIGAALFTRGARGSLLTEAGEALVRPARQMQTASHALHLAASGQSQSLKGTVRITASETTCAYMLPNILLGLRKKHPDIQIELVANNGLDNLLEREADIAIRMTKPTQDTLVARYLGDMSIGGYASKAYLAQKNVAFSPTTFSDFNWVGHDKSTTLIDSARSIGITMGREAFDFRCDNLIVCWQAVLAGLGIGFGFEVLAQAHPELVRVLPPDWVPDIPVWLTAPIELRSNPRIRAVFDHLVEHLTPFTHPPKPRPAITLNGN